MQLPVSASLAWGRVKDSNPYAIADIPLASNEFGHLGRHSPNWRKRRESNSQRLTPCPASNGVGLAHAQLFHGGEQTNRRPAPWRHTGFQPGPHPLRFTLQTGGAPGSQTQSSRKMYGLANRCIVVLPALRTWWGSWDSNPDLTAFETVASANCARTPKFGRPPEIRTRSISLLRRADLPFFLAAHGVPSPT